MTLYTNKPSSNPDSSLGRVEHSQISTADS